MTIRGCHRFLWAGSLLVGCSGDVGHFRPPPDAGGSSFARLRITLTVPRDGDPALATEARLLRFRDLDADSAQILAGATVPSLESLAVGRCVRVDGEDLLEDALATSSPDAQVAMLDAGELVIRAGARTVRMAPRYVPEVLPFVSGVVYESDASGQGALPPPEVRAGDEAFVSAYGGEDVGRFDAVAAIPGAPHIASIGTAGGERRDLELRWTIDSVDGDAPADGVIVSVAWAGGELRCRAAGGSFTVPAELLPPAGTDAQIAVERIARTPFTAAGLDAADIEVGVRDVVAARVD